MDDAADAHVHELRPRGPRFRNAALGATSDSSADVAAYASRDTRSGDVFVILVNQRPEGSIGAALQLDGLSASARVQTYRNAGDSGIEHDADTVLSGGEVSITLAANSMTLVRVGP